MTIASTALEATVSVMPLRRIQALDERGWLYTVELDIESGTTTITVNGLLRHQTRFRTDGHFETLPRWLPDELCSELERRASEEDHR